MPSLFADTHNVAAILEKLDAAEGFEQIIDFLSGSYIHYALTVTSLGVVCLPNVEIFAGLAQMGYGKSSTKLTFYKAFFSSQWKFLIHTILQSLSAKRTSWNKFSTAMASTMICLSKGQRFNFSKYIFDSLAQVGDLSSHTTRFISPALTQKVFANMRRVGKGFSGVETPLFAEDVEEHVATDVSHDAVPSSSPHDIPSPSHEPSSPPQQPHVNPPVPTQGEALPVNFHQKLEIVKLKARVKKLEQSTKVKSSKLRRLKKVGTSQRVESSDDVENVFNQGRKIIDMDQDEGIELVADQEKDAEVGGRHAAKHAEIYNIDLDHPLKVLSMQEDDTKVQEAVEVVTTAKLMTKVVTTAAT
nr:hypothetical protein [Tanacetum cinerariifolium]